MTKEEVIKALDEGKKVRAKHWIKSQWVKKYDDESIVDEDGIVYPFDSIWIEDYDWELFQEPEKYN